MEQFQSKIESIVKPFIGQHEVEFVDMKIGGSRHDMVLQIFVDVAGGITIEKCGQISRELGKLLEFSDVFPGKFRLDVSSPGLDRPLVSKADFVRNAGRLVKVLFTRSDTEVETVSGEIKSVDGDAVVVLSEQGELVRIDLAVVLKALIQIRW